ncbi:MAG: flagellar hook-length control protein FliK [Oscillospiraceae bacterium]|jgi:flagellar hook-length control protein FliK|nr:flagellar hook-length control protein FliK [Oscillospiraceae bacterium]
MQGIDIIGAVRTAETVAAETTAAQTGQGAVEFASAPDDRGESGFTRALSEARGGADAVTERGSKPEVAAKPAPGDAPEPDAAELDGAEQSTQTEQIDMSVLAALFAAIPRDAQATDMVPDGGDAPAETVPAETAAPTVESACAAPELVTILEGTKPATDGAENTDYTDYTSASAPARDTEIAVASDEQARMPQARMRTGTQRQIPEEREVRPADIRDDAPCPLENVNEENHPIVSRTAGERSAKSGGEPEQDGAEPESGGETPPAQTPVDVAPEKVFAAERLKSAPAEQPTAATRESLFDTMVERLEIMREDGVSAMSVELKPEYLGRVTLNLSMTGGGVSVKISASDPEVKGMIDGQIAALIDNLSGKGVKIESVDVVYAGVSGGEYDGFGARSDPGGGGGRGSPRKSRGGGAADDSARVAAYAPELMWASVGDEDTNTFEYSA